MKSAGRLAKACRSWLVAVGEACRLTSGFRRVTRKQRVARPGKVGIHLGRRSIDVPSFDHRKDAPMLIGDHLGIKEMTHLHLRHTQVRLANNQVMKALDSRAA